MNQSKQYESFIKKYIPGFKCTSFKVNNFISALEHEQFKQFSLCFQMRLLAISDFLKESKNDQCNKKFENLLQNLCQREYESAYSELTAWYNLIMNFGDYVQIKCDVQVTNSTDTFLDKNVDYDFQVGNVYIDVKILQDKIVKVIQNYFYSLKKDTKYQNIHLLPEITDFLTYQTITDNLGKIKVEVKQFANKFLKNEQSEAHYKSKHIPNLNYRFLKGQGILTAHAAPLDPYFFALSEHSIVHQHISKLHKREPTVLLYVLHPWYSPIISSKEQNVAIALRAFARRIFMGYIENSVPNKDEKKPKNPYQFLSGLMFIVDNSVKTCRDQIYFFTNPNAKNPLSDSFIDFLRFKENCTFDNFLFDNY